MVRSGFAVLAAGLLLAAAGCGGGSTVFLHPEYNFQVLERVAVIPFDNLSKDQGAGARATRVFVTELLAAEAFDVVEPGEVTRALEEYATVRTAELTQEQIVGLGKALRVQGMVLGTVTESTTLRSGGSAASTVTMVARMVETETGATVWSATQTSGGRGFWASLFGTGDKSHAEVMQACARSLLNTLVK
ncbi:MAG TPA: hypothetical protein VMY05_02165 [Acidobacteriota bacterium]|nr:hypothetical protein [Acidobacteriota bacterium]